MPSSTARDTILRYYQEVWNQRKLETITEFLTPSFVGHERNTNDVYGPDGVRLVANTFFENFPDATFTIVGIIAEGDRVAAHLYFEAMNRTTNRPVKVSGMIFLRLDKGKIIETWSN